MIPMLIWAAALIVLLLAWVAKFNMLDRRINALAAELVRMSKAEPDAAKQDRQARLQQRSDIVSWVLLVATVAVCAALPPVPRDTVYNAVRSESVGWLIVGCLVVLLQLELSPYFFRTIARLRLRGLLVELLKFAIAAAALFVIVTLPLSEQPLFLHPIYLYPVRQFLLGNMAFCGALTLYREHRRRVRTGDLFRYGTRDSLRVALQVLILFNVVAVLITVPVRMGLQVSGLLDPRQTLAAGFNFLAFIWTWVSIGYFILYLLRIINHARGFSWIDPPNWRVAIPHLRYHFGWFGFFQVAVLIAVSIVFGSWITSPPKPLSWIHTPLKVAALVVELVAIAIFLLYRFRAPDTRRLGWLRPAHWPRALTLAFRHGFSPPLADVVRVTYLRSLFPRANDDVGLLAYVARRGDRAARPPGRRSGCALRHYWRPGRGRRQPALPGQPPPRRGQADDQYLEGAQVGSVGRRRAAALGRPAAALAVRLRRGRRGRPRVDRLYDHQLGCDLPGRRNVRLRARLLPAQRPARQPRPHVRVRARERAPWVVLRWISSWSASRG